MKVKSVSPKNIPNRKKSSSSTDIENESQAETKEEGKTTVDNQGNNDARKNRDNAAVIDEDKEEEEQSKEDEIDIKLYKSSRLKGYMTLFLASTLNYIAAVQSDQLIIGNAVASTQRQKRYALASSMASGIVNLLAILVHCDRITSLEKSVWVKAFGPKSRFELGFIVSLLLWWVIATWIQTGVRGIAGDGKGQYNLYFTTWACCATCIWLVERWLVAYGLSSMKKFLSSWPNRAPGWIAICILSLSDLLCILDLYLNWRTASRGARDSNQENDTTDTVSRLFEDVAQGQFVWLLFLTSVTILPAACFVLMELFRESKTDQGEGDSSNCGTIIEGIILTILILSWIPSVIVATTPGGVASDVGNVYFFTWACGVFVMETFVWWIHDWRESIHTMLEQQENEYKSIQKGVLAKTRAEVVAFHNNDLNNNKDDLTDE